MFFFVFPFFGGKFKCVPIYQLIYSQSPFLAFKIHICLLFSTIEFLNIFFSFPFTVIYYYIIHTHFSTPFGNLTQTHKHMITALLIGHKLLFRIFFVSDC